MPQEAITVKYNISAPSLKARLRLALISDIHERRADDILELLNKAAPDAIFIAGDTLERYDSENNRPEPKKKYNPVLAAIYTAVYYLNHFFLNIFAGNNLPDTDNAYRFLSGAARLAPVFMSLGNHEERLLAQDHEFLEREGITLLDNSDCLAEIKGETLRIGGLSSVPDEEWLERFSEKEGFKLLLSHYPEKYETLLRDKPIDLILSGHNHGGQIRLFGRGLVSSGLRLFPRYDRGLFDGRLVVSAGCSNTAPFPRLGNPREVVIVETV